MFDLLNKSGDKHKEAIFWNMRKIIPNETTPLTSSLITHMEEERCLTKKIGCSDKSKLRIQESLDLLNFQDWLSLLLSLLCA